jgi:hypothetical protein
VSTKKAKTVSAAVTQPGEQKLYCYVSVGDCQWYSNILPMDSAATIDALFEWMANTYGVKRVYWRGEIGALCVTTNSAKKTRFTTTVHAGCVILTIT